MLKVQHRLRQNITNTKNLFLSKWEFKSVWCKCQGPLGEEGNKLGRITNSNTLGHTKGKAPSTTVVAELQSGTTQHRGKGWETSKPCGWGQKEVRQQNRWGKVWIEGHHIAC